MRGVRVPRDGGLGARVVLGGAGEDFVRGGRGEQFGLEGVGLRDGIGGTRAVCASKMYHGVVHNALGWACWKTLWGRPEGDGTSVVAMRCLGADFTRCSPR